MPISHGGSHPPFLWETRRFLVNKEILQDISRSDDQKHLVFHKQKCLLPPDTVWTMCPHLLVYYSVHSKLISFIEPLMSPLFCLKAPYYIQWPFLLSLYCSLFPYLLWGRNTGSVHIVEFRFVDCRNVNTRSSTSAISKLPACRLSKIELEKINVQKSRHRKIWNPDG